MKILIDGNRANSESWFMAHQLTSSELPGITPQEQRTAEQLGLSAEEYSRAKYATDLTALELGERARQLGDLLRSWLQSHQIGGEIRSITLKTFEGKYRIEIGFGDRLRVVLVSEDVVNDLFESGSRQAKDSLDEIFAVNLLPELAKAS